MLTIPTRATPAQTLRVLLADQACTISLYQKPQGLFADISVDETLVSAGVICRDCVPLTVGAFVGNLIIVDTTGASDPNYAELGMRFVLVYMTADEYAIFNQ
jgi:hypothetical protein